MDNEPGQQYDDIKPQVLAVFTKLNVDKRLIDFYVDFYAVMIMASVVNNVKRKDDTTKDDNNPEIGHGVDCKPENSASLSGNRSTDHSTLQVAAS